MRERTERDTEGAGQDMSMPLRLFLASGSLFLETSDNVNLRFLVKRQISMADLSWGHKRTLFFMDIQGVSGTQIIICVCLLDHSELTMIGCFKMMQNSRNTYIHIRQNIFALKTFFYIQQLYIYAALRSRVYSTSRK